MKNLGTHFANTRRRWLATGAGLPALGWMDALRAQANPRLAPMVIGWLNVNSREASLAGLAAFNQGMAELGWKLGARYRLEERYADGRLDRLPALAQELAARNPAVIVTMPSPAAKAAAEAAPTTPIVLANGDPLTFGLVTSLARPGGMITGLSNVTADLNQKVVELLVESQPLLKRVGLLADSSSPRLRPFTTSARRAAEHFRVEAIVADAARPEDIEPAFERLVKAKVQGLVILSSTWSAAHLPNIMSLPLAQRWPVVGNLPAIPRLGGLFSYGPDRVALYRRAAFYVDRILKGAKPGDLPIEQPTTFEMVLNMKTAKTLGIKIPRSIFSRATEVIE